MGWGRDVSSKPIAYQDGLVVEERLPLPWVHYPGHYGTFFAFSETCGGTPRLCSCAYAAMVNHASARGEPPADGETRGDPTDLALDRGPRALGRLRARGAACPTGDRVTEFEVSQGLCHECNCAVPSYRYCHPMYGGPFEQHFGWYVNKQAYHWGLRAGHGRFSDACPQQVRDLFTMDPGDYERGYDYWLARGETEPDTLRRQRQQQDRLVSTAIENEVRRRMGYPPKGRTGVEETALYHIVRRLYDNRTVLHNARPPFLQGLQLDVFVPELSLGVEYQGVQHFQSVSHWGAENGLAKLQARDRLKDQFCREAGIRLVCVRYDEPLTEPHVASVIRRCSLAQLRRMRRGAHATANGS